MASNTIPKKPAFLQQVKTLVPPSEQKITVPYNEKDIEMAALLSQIKASLSKKYPAGQYSSYSKALNMVINNAQKVPDALEYLTKVVKFLDPTYKDVLYKVGSKVAPGKTYGFSVPQNQSLSTKAQQALPKPETAEKVNALSNKIIAYNAEISRLKQAQQSAENAAQKAQEERKKLGATQIDAKLLKYFSYIEKNCSEFLKSVTETQKLLFRGQDDASQPIFVAYPRKNRESKDSDPEAQKLVDKYLTVMGFNALRSNSIFTTSDYDQAIEYGTVYAIFPKNGFKYTWSTKHDDLVLSDETVRELGGSDSTEYRYYQYNDYVGQLFDVVHRLEFFLGDNFNIQEEYKEYKNIVKKIKSNDNFKNLKREITKWNRLNYYDNNAKELSESFLEIINFYKKASAQIKYFQKIFNKRNEKVIAKLVEIAKTEIKPSSGNIKSKAAGAIKSFGFTDKNLSAAIKSSHEICILGEYIAVNFDNFEDELTQYFIPGKIKAKKK